MPWWIPITVAGMAALGVLTVVASTAAGRHEGRHVLTGPQEEWDAWSAEQPFYGSAILGEELTWRNSSPLTVELEGVPEWLPAAVDPEPWLAQMTAELSPDALDDLPPLSRDLSGDLDAIPSHRIDPGPGVPPSSLTVAPGPVTDLDGGAEDCGFAPSPAPVQPSRWLAEQLAITYAWSDWMQEKARIFA